MHISAVRFIHTGSITVTLWWTRWRIKSPASRLFTQQFVSRAFSWEHILCFDSKSTEASSWRSKWQYASNVSHAVLASIWHVIFWPIYIPTRINSTFPRGRYIGTDIFTESLTIYTMGDKANEFWFRQLFQIEFSLKCKFQGIIVWNNT